MPDTGPARVLGRYQLHGVLASGGMATVHLGRLLGGAGFQRTVAIKRMHPQFARDPEFASMFLDEARLAGRIRHPNVVSVIDVVALDDEMWLVMDYVEGESLGRLLRTAFKQGELVPPAIASAIVGDALLGLQAAHEARDEKGQPLGIVHRDVSPQNIIVGADGVSRVLDFGIAKASGTTHVTREGQLKGKLAYMSPEQLHGSASPKVDIHAMGIVLWETLTGTRLFAAENEGTTVTRVLHDIPEPPGTIVDLPPGFDAVTAKALAKNPVDRYATAQEMATALASCGRAADPHEVSLWVQRIAKDVLDARAEVVSQVETAPSMRLEDIAPRDGSTESGRPSVTPATRADLSSDLTRERAVSSRAPLAIAVSAALLLAVTLGVVLLRAPPGPPPSLASASSAPAPSAAPVPSPIVKPTPADVSPSGDAAIAAVPTPSATPSRVAPGRPASSPHARPPRSSAATTSPSSPATAALPEHL